MAGKSKIAMADLWGIWALVWYGCTVVVGGGFYALRHAVDGIPLVVWLLAAVGTVIAINLATEFSIRKWRGKRPAEEPDEVTSATP